MRNTKETRNALEEAHGGLPNDTHGQADQLHAPEPDLESDEEKEEEEEQKNAQKSKEEIVRGGETNEFDRKCFRGCSY